MSDPTILDYLNEDCWSLVLSYVPLRDIMRTECTSWQWQRMVLTYLSRIKVYFHLLDDNRELTGIVKNVRWAMLPDANISSFEIWTQKLGSSVVAGYCNDRTYKVIGENCPNLERVTFICLPEELLLNNQYKNFQKLQKLRFIHSYNMTDDTLNQFIASPGLEELLISFNDKVTGACFTNMQSTHLKSLDLQYCQAFACQLLAMARDRFGEMRKLVLEAISVLNFDSDPEAGEPLDDILLVLEKTPKLEYLISAECGKYVDHFFEAVCRLSCLRTLEIDISGTDESLEAVTRSCPDLRVLKFEKFADRTRASRCVYTCAAVRHGERGEATLAVPHSRHLTDDDVVAFVRACPSLKELKVTFCRALTRHMLLRVAAARRELRARSPLRLLWFEMNSDNHENREPFEEFDELELHNRLSKRFI